MDHHSPFSNHAPTHRKQDDNRSPSWRPNMAAFPWMSQLPPLLPPALPRPPQPIVHEGFIPNTPSALSNIDSGLFLADSELGANSPPVFGELPDGSAQDGRSANSWFDGSPVSTAATPSNEQESGGWSPVESPALAELNIMPDDIPPPKRKRGRPPNPIPKDQRPKKPRKHTGQRGGWSKGMRLGPRATVEASPEYNRLYTNAVRYLLEEPSDPQKALELITQAIALNPEQHKAHPVLAEAHHRLGNDEAAIDTLFVGAHANPKDPEPWQDVLQRCLEWTGIGRKAALEKALIACSGLLDLNRHDMEIRFLRASIFREQSKPLRCINELHKVLEVLPHNSSAMQEYAKACVDMQLIQQGVDLYKEAIEHYLEVGLGGEDSFEWGDICAYADLVSRNGKPAEALPAAIKVLKKLSRWLQGRQLEAYWEEYSLEHDAEFDMADEPRRITIPDYMPGRRPPEAYGQGLPLELRAQLGILRLRRGDRMEALSHFKWLLDARDHDGTEDVRRLADLMLQAARALTDTKEHGEALQFYQLLRDAEAMDTHSFWAGMGHSSYVCNQKDEALDCFQRALECDAESVEAKTWIGKILMERGEKLEAIETLKDAVETAQDQIVRKQETRIYEKRQPRLLREEAERALKEATADTVPTVKRKYKKRNAAAIGADQEGIQADENGDDSHLRPFHKSRRDKQLPRESLNEDDAERHERVLQYHTTLQGNTQAMRAGDTIARGIWIDCAKSLIADFRSNRVFFAKDRHKSSENADVATIEAINRLADYPIKDTRNSSETPVTASPALSYPTASPTLCTTYRTIPFSTWLDIILEYSLLLTLPSPDTPASNAPDPSSRRACYECVSTALNCIPFTINPDYMFQIQICHLICCMAFQDEKTLFNTVLRWFLREHAFCTDAYRLFGAMNYYFPYFQPSALNAKVSGGKESIVQRSIFRNSNTSKALRRHVYAIDKALVEDYISPQEGPVPAFMREERHETFTAQVTEYVLDPVTGATKTKKTPMRTLEMDVVLLVLYGQILYATGSFISALSYFYRAKAVDPDNPLVLLSIALSYMHQLQKKAETNRHTMVLQGWAMFQEYEDKRLAWAAQEEADEGVEGVMDEVRREIIFNKARCWDMLGLPSNAKREYEKLFLRERDVVDPALRDGDIMIGEEVGGDCGKWTTDAAYALSNMYLVSGDVASARVVAERYLLVE